MKPYYITSSFIVQSKKAKDLSIGEKFYYGQYFPYEVIRIEPLSETKITIVSKYIYKEQECIQKFIIRKEGNVGVYKEPDISNIKEVVLKRR